MKSNYAQSYLKIDLGDALIYNTGTLILKKENVMPKSSQNSSKHATARALEQKYQYNFNIYKPIIEFQEGEFTSFEDIQAQIDSALQPYNTVIVTSPQNTELMDIQWNLYELKAIEDERGWSLAQLECLIKLQKVGEMYVISAHRFNGDTSRFAAFLHEFQFHLTGEIRPQLRRLVAPPIPSFLKSQDLSWLNSYKIKVKTAKDSDIAGRLFALPILISFAGELFALRNKNTTDTRVAIDEIIDEMLALICDVTAEELKINDSIDKVDGAIDEIFANPRGMSEIAVLARMAVQLLYVLSYDAYYLDRLLSDRSLMQQIELLANYQPARLVERYLYAEMNQAPQKVLHKLATYKDNLPYFFSKKVNKPMLPRNLSMQYVPGDGDCLYHAVRMHLHGNPSVATLRTQVADYVAAHRTDYENHITGTFDAYVAGIRTNAWADHVEIDALMHLYQRPIFIFHENGGPVTQPEALEAFPGEPIPVLFDDVNHYNGVVLNTDRFNLQQAVQSAPESIIPQLPEDLCFLIATFLTISDLELFLGGAKQVKVLVERKEASQLTMFAPPGAAAEAAEDDAEEKDKETNLSSGL